MADMAEPRQQGVRAAPASQVVERSGTIFFRLCYLFVKFSDTKLILMQYAGVVNVQVER